MGGPMAGHLLAAGHRVRIHTRTRARAEELLSRGAVWCDSPAQAAQGAQAVFICVNDTPDVRRVILEENGVVHGMSRGTVIVDHSTISPSATKQMAEEVSRHNGYLLDAPVSGGDVGARNGTLSIMVGGDPQALERVQPLLRCYGKTITYCGPSGTGQSTKLVNQILVSITLMGVCEALTFARNNGLNLATTIEAVGAGAGASWQLTNLGPRMIQGDFRPGFMIDMLQKDLRILLDAGQHSRTSLPASSLVHQLFTAAQAAGHGKDGTQALYTVLCKLAALH